jgi:hypothetical protein
MSAIVTNLPRYGQAGAAQTVQALQILASKVKNLSPLPKIQEWANQVDIVSRTFYNTSQIVLIGVSAIGLVTSIGLFATGMPGAGAILAAASACNIFGAFMTNQASLQKAFADSVGLLWRFKEGLQEHNHELEKVVGALDQSNQQLKGQIHLLTSEREGFSSEREGLSKENGILRRNNMTLEETTAALKKQVELNAMVLQTYAHKLDQAESQSKLNRVLNR